MRAMTLLSATIVIGSIVYYLVGLPPEPTRAIVWIAAGLLVIFGARKAMTAWKTRRGWMHNTRLRAADVIILFAYFSALIASFVILFQSATTESLRSPWDVVPASFFVAAACAIFFGIVVLARLPRAPLLILSPLFFLFFSVAWIIFPVGYGFDPFIHQATERVIVEHGVITPKPFYYIGHYVLVTLLAHLTQLPVHWIDRLLVPFLAALLIPWSVMRWMRRFDLTPTLSSKERETTSDGVVREGMAAGCARTGLTPRGHGPRPIAGGAARASSLSPVAGRGEESEGTTRRQNPERRLTPLILLSLPFLIAQFIMTTPQALAITLLIALIFFASTDTPRKTLALLALAIFFIHPLVGIPAILFVALPILARLPPALRIIAYALAAVALPLAFTLASFLADSVAVHWSITQARDWLSALSLPSLYRENRFNALFDLIYFYGFNTYLFFFFFVLTPIALAMRRRFQRKGMVPEGRADARADAPSDLIAPLRAGYPAHGGMRSMCDRSEASRWSEPNGREGRCAGGRGYALPFLLVVANAAILRAFLSFDFLVTSERTDYADRLFAIALLFLLPLFLSGVAWWTERVASHGAWAWRRLAIAGTVTLTIALFLSYPQNVRRYAINPGFTTGAADLAAVEWINRDAAGASYIVLANQAVSAAAVKQFGFAKYYQTASGAAFYYPIPTGSPLYPFYLRMVEDEPTAATLEAARTLVGADRVYFVLNRYWTNFPRIVEQADGSLKRIATIDDRIVIYTLR